VQWLREFYPRLKEHVVECVQEQGDVLYVPSDWYHGVINMRDSAGVVVEIGHHTGLLQSLLGNGTAAAAA
jgi:ribosomal protein L16 Arg81 hydroxylase